ncbi:hypothetical protein ACS3QZ_04555 [Shimia sp. W99]
MSSSHLALACALLAPLAVQAQESVFTDYDDYARYVDARVMNRDFIPLIKRLGGSSKYTEPEIVAINNQLMNAMRHDFTDAAVIKDVDLGNGFRQEARVYWHDRLGYTYFYAFLHDRGDSLVVLRFDLNTNSNTIFEKF